jgi:hypothetical protein
VRIRAAWAAIFLGSLIAIASMGQITPVRAEGEFTPFHEPVLRKPAISESVAILEFPEDVDGFGFSHKRDLVRLSYWPIPIDAGFQSSSWSNINTRRFIRPTAFELGLERIFPQVTLGPKGCAISGGLTKVLYFDAYLGSTENIRDFCRTEENIRPQLFPGILVSTAYKVASSNPKEDRRESQNDGEYDKDFVFSVMDKVTEAVPVGFGHNIEGGTIIFRGILGGLFLVLLYAGLKRR